MKKWTLFLAFVALLNTYALEPYQGQDHQVESWRCGAPVVEALREKDIDGKLKAVGVNADLKESLEAVSKSNIDYNRKKLGALTADEQALMDLIKDKYPVPIVHRTHMDVAQILLAKRQALSSPVKRDEPPRVTPGIEQSLFAGWDCIYASAGPAYGIQNYGTVLVRLKNESNFSWGSIYTGFSWTLEVLERSIYLPATENMKRLFARQIYTNNHYNEAIGLQIIGHIRAGTSIRDKGYPYDKSAILKELLAIDSPDRFWRKVAAHRLGFLEAHYTDDVSLQDVEFVQFRTKDMGDVAKWNLPSSWFGASADSGLIQHFDREN